MSLLAFMACAVEDRLPIEFPIVAGGTELGALSTTDGGAVELTSAEITFSDVRLEEPADDGTTTALLERLWPIPSAYAHPGHDYPGAVAAELLGTYTVDLLGADVELGLARGYEGDFATGRVSVAGTVASLAGVYTPVDGDPEPFAFTVEADQDIVGITFEETLDATAPPTSVDLRFDVSAALAFVDWTEPDADGDGTLTVVDGTYGHTAAFGVVATPTWSFTLVP